jgi:hypothetical protein
MTTQQPPTWGAPQPNRPRSPWSTKRVVVAAALAVVIVGGGTAAVFAATNDGNTGTGNGPGGGPGGSGGGFGRGGFGMGGGLENALHGDFVVGNGSSGTTKERLQNGTVTAVSATDLTVRSTDGYTQTYTVDAKTVVDRGNDTIGKVAKGNDVTVIATVSGSTATASTIEDSSIDSRFGQGRSGQGGPPGGGPGGN